VAEDVQQIFIRPPAGWDEEPGVVYEVLRPLYGIPSSALALGCEVIRDRVAGTLKLRQAQYIQRVLATHGMLEANPVKTPLEPGAQLSSKDCPGAVRMTPRIFIACSVGWIATTPPILTPAAQ